MLIGILVFILWVIIVSLCFIIGLTMTNGVAFLIGLCLLFVPFIIGECHNSFTKSGRKKNRRNKEKQKKIEKEYGLIEYWEDK